MLVIAKEFEEIMDITRTLLLIVREILSIRSVSELQHLHRKHHLLAMQASVSAKGVSHEGSAKLNAINDHLMSNTHL